MGPRNLLILFFSTVAVSLVILIIFFSLFFKNVDLNFNTRLPESAPEIGRQFSSGPTMNQDSKADGLTRSTVNVPPEMQETPADAKKKNESEAPLDSDLPPVSDDAVLQRDNPAPLADPAEEAMPKDESVDMGARTGIAPPAPRNPRPIKRSIDTPPPSPAPMPAPRPVLDESAPIQPSGPPIPGQ